MDPISPLLNTNQKQKPPSAPPRTPALSGMLHGTSTSPYEIRAKLFPELSEGMQGPCEECGLAKGGATWGNLPPASCFMDGNYPCSIHHNAVPAAGSLQAALSDGFANIRGSSKKATKWFYSSPSHRANTHGHKSLQAAQAGCCIAHVPW